MPDFEAAANTIRSQFNSQFGALSPTYDIAWENVTFTPPDREPWVRFTIREGEASLPAFGGGSNVYRHPGVVIVQVFAPDGTGDGTARQIADSIAAIYRGKRLSGVRFFDAPYINVVGTDGAWFQINVYAPFEYDLLT